MAELKTLPNDASVKDFLNTLTDDAKRQDSLTLLELFTKATGQKPKMWGSSIIGFGNNHYKYDTGREGDTVAVGFSPRKSALVLYGVVYYDQNLHEVEKLGKYKLGKGCLYINKLSDIDLDVLSSMITEAFRLRNND